MKFGNTKIGGMSFGPTKIGGAKYGNTLVFNGGGPAPFPTPIFDLPAETSTQQYATGVHLFTSPMDFTIFVDATWNHYGWNTGSQYQALFGIGTAARNLFRLGRIENGEDYVDGVYFSTGNRYAALIMNLTESGKMCTAVYARGTNAAQRRQLTVRYDHTTKQVRVDNSDDRQVCYFSLSGDLESTLSLYLLTGGATGTVHSFKVYDTRLTDTQIAELLHP